MKPYNQLKQDPGAPAYLAGFIHQIFGYHSRCSKFPILLIFALLMGMGRKARASEVAKNLWPLIETQLDQQDADSSYHFIFLLVRGHCGQNFNCLPQSPIVTIQKILTLELHFFGSPNILPLKIY